MTTEGKRPRRRSSSHRTVVTQSTSVRCVYHYALALECGHMERRVSRTEGVVYTRIKCHSCIPSVAAEEVVPEVGWWRALERLLPGKHS